MPSQLVPTFSMPARNRRVLLVNRPPAIPQTSDFEIVDAEIPSPGEGQILVRNIYLSVDPAQRGWACDGTNYAPPVPLGTTMRALGIAKVLKSSDPAVPVGAFIYGWVGWQDYSLLAATDILTCVAKPEVRLSAYAGILGINGLTAHLAFSEIGQPKPGNTVLVSTAAGSVGSVVGQLARAAGCHTIGLTGDDAKVGRCTANFGYDVGINYKTADVATALEEHAPQGVDVFFDNVGGAMLDTALRHMAIGGRIVQCGTASVPSWTVRPTGLRNEREVMTRRLRWGGFVIFDHRDRFNEEVRTLAAMISAGTLRYDEDISQGIESAPDAIRALYAGENEGKKLIFVG